MGTSVSKSAVAPACKGQVCSSCASPGTADGLYVCSRCKSAFYCSKDCQRSSWASHKIACVAQRIPPYICLEATMPSNEKNLDSDRVVEGVSNSQQIGSSSSILSSRSVNASKIYPDDPLVLPTTFIDNSTGSIDMPEALRISLAYKVIKNDSHELEVKTSTGFGVTAVGASSASLDPFLSDKMTLIQACTLGSLEDAKRLLTDENVNMFGMWQSTPLIVSLQKNYLDIALLLLTNQKIDIHHVNDKGESALLYACMLGHADLVKDLLIGRSADANSLATPEIYIEKIDKSMTVNPLSIACIYDRAAVVSVLIDSGQYDINCRFPFMAWRCGSGVDTNSSNLHESGVDMTPLSLACAAGSVDVVHNLLLRCANLSSRDANGGTALHNLLRSNFTESQEGLCLEILNAFKKSMEGSKKISLHNELRRIGIMKGLKSNINADSSDTNIFKAKDALGASLLQIASDNLQAKVRDFLVLEGCKEEI